MACDGSPRAILEALLTLRLLRRTDLISPGLSVTPLSSRSATSAVRRTDGAGFVVKKGLGAEGRAALRHEAAVYRLLEAKASRGEGFHPHLRAYRPRDALLVLDLAAGARSLGAVTRGREVPARRFAAGLGRALAALHALDAAALRGPAPSPSTRSPPWVLRIHRPRAHALWTFSRGNLAFLRLVQEEPTLGELLDELRADWRDDRLIHRDLKWDNCVVSDGRVLLVDFELCGPGDPHWDVGSIFAAFLVSWIDSIPFAPDLPAAGAAALARSPLARMWPAIGAFWRSYAAAAVGTGARGARHRDEAALRSARYLGARLVLSATERVQQSGELTAAALYLLQLGLNVLRRPREALTSLLGLET